MWTIRQINKIFPKWIAWFFILLDFLWEFPQILVGTIVKLVYIRYGSREVETYKQGVCQIQNWGMTSGVSLGWWQFTWKYADKNTASHEIGHSVQSVMLGWFYLPTVGLCSAIHALLYRYTRLYAGQSYYDYWCEAWSNKLSGAYGG